MTSKFFEKTNNNSPIILTFAVISFIAVIADLITMGLVNRTFSTPSGLYIVSPLFWINLFSHIFCHSGFDHYWGNVAFILLIGPIIEEKFGFLRLLIMILITAATTALFSAMFFNSAILGASGIVFMMIIIGSITNKQDGKIPRTFVIIFAIYMTKEIWSALGNDNISQFAHLMGGACGAVFGFLVKPKGKN